MLAGFAKDIGCFVGLRIAGYQPEVPIAPKLLRRLGADMEAATGLPCPLWHRGLALHVDGSRGVGSVGIRLPEARKGREEWRCIDMFGRQLSEYWFSAPLPLC